MKIYSTDNPLTVVMDGNKSITANFTINTYTLSISAVNGSVAKVPDQPTYDHGTSVQLTATADPGYHFTGWSGDASGTDNPLTVVMDGNKSITANFAINTYTLSVSAVNGSVAKVPDQPTYDHGTSVQLTATPAEGYHFTGWSGDSSGSDNPLTVVMDDNKNITANFAINTYTLTVSSVNGSVAKVPDQLTYDHGTSVQLTATPAEGYHFTGWSGDASGTDNPLTVVMDDNKNVTANFAINTYTLSISAVNGAVAKVPDQLTYDHGTSVELTATATPGYHFTGWSGDASGTDNPLTVVMDGNKSVTANFAINTYTLTISAVNGSVAKVPDQPTYDHGTSVQLTATPAEEYHFTGWSGDASGTDNPLTVVMNGNKSITANFAINTYTLGVSAVNGSVSKVPNQPSYVYGTSVQVIATPNVGYHFTTWSGDLTGSVNPTTVLMDRNKNITANFTINVYIITASNIGSGTITPSGPINVNHGASRSFTVAPNMGYHIDSVVVDGLNVGVVTDYLFSNVTANHTITAYFSINQYSLDVSVSGMGSVIKNPDQSLYPHGSTVVLTAVANTGYHFLGWSGDFSGRTNPLNILMDAQKSIKATFMLDSTSMVMYRSFTPESLALGRDNNGKLGKIVKRKPDKVDFICFIVNSVEGAEQLHVEFSQAIDLSFPMNTIPVSTPVSEEPKLKKWKYTFETPLHQGDTVYISGFGNRGKFQKVSKYWWMIGGILAGEKGKNGIFVRNTLKMPMPNRFNVLYETFMQGGYLATNGMLVGVTRTDSPKCYGWFQTLKHSDVIKTLITSKTIQTHTAPPHGFDVFANGKLMLKQQKSLPPSKYNNRLLSSMIALKLNIVASAMGKTPRGFGELIYDDDSGNPLNGLTVKEIARYGDTIMMGHYYAQLNTKLFRPAGVFMNLDTTIRKINSAFEGSLDTLSFGDSLVFKGVRRLVDVPYLIVNLNATPEVIIAADAPMYELPNTYVLHQNYPNPFNPTTTIAFDLPMASIVTIRVYNLLGQEVQTVLNRVEFEEGTEEIEFTADNLSSGVYFYQIIAESIGDDGLSGTYSEVKKMMLLR